MFIDYQFLCKNKRVLQGVLGMNQSQFEKLLPEFEVNMAKIQLEKAFAKERKRAPGGGRKSKYFNSPFKLLFLTLFFVRIYPTYDLASFVLGVEKSILHYWFEIGFATLEMTMKSHILMPAKKTRTFTDLIGQIPELSEHIIDATEQPINRPKYNQKKYYSGKKKRHTKKRQIIITPGKKLLVISTTVEGKKHDKKLAEEERYLLRVPPDSKMLGDTAYIGEYSDNYNNVRIITPIKKKPGKKLSKGDKAFNQVVSSVRVRVEHVIGHLKFNRIFSDKLRYRKDIYDDMVSNVVGGLYNYKRGD